MNFHYNKKLTRDNSLESGHSGLRLRQILLREKVNTEGRSRSFAGLARIKGAERRRITTDRPYNSL